MPRIALGLEYIGSEFHGWQSQQPGVRTVQGCVEAALSQIAAHPITVICAGRTDTGVHALGQVVHFDTAVQRPLSAWVRGTNVHLPPDVSIQWAQVVDSQFNARFSALARHYCYWISNTPYRSATHHQRAYSYQYPLDVTRMQMAANALLGEHDFTSFRAAECQARHAWRCIERLQVTRQGDLIRIDVIANAFLHHMVRNLVGVLIPVGGGLKPVEWAQAVLLARDRTQAGMTVPPDGLYLVGVHYPQQAGLACLPSTTKNPMF